MVERTIALLAAQACAIALTWAASADEVPDNYLPGTWAIGGAEACGTPAAEHITFDPDGTFRAVRGEQPTATGFWHLVEDVLDLHMVSSPAFFDDPATRFDDALSDFAGQYQYFYAKTLLFDIAPDGFRAVASMGKHAARRELQPLPVSAGLLRRRRTARWRRLKGPRVLQGVAQQH